MSDASEKELSDIELCYKAMGLSFSDNPEQVQSTYRKLKDEYGKALRSPETSERATAAENMKQLEELYETITGSMIYKDYAKEYEKYKAKKAEEMAARKKNKPEKPPEENPLVHCPYCNKLIAPKLRECIYCHGKILTPMEKMMAKLFSTRNMIVAAVVVLLIVAAIVFTQYPQLLQR